MDNLQEYTSLFNQYIDCSGKYGRTIESDLRCSIRDKRIIFVFNKKGDAIGFIAWSRIGKHTVHSIVKTGFWPSMPWEKNEGYITFIEHIFFRENISISERKGLFSRFLLNRKCILLPRKKKYSLWIYGKKITVGVNN